MNDLAGALLLSVSLSFDALAVGMAYGFKRICVPFVSKMIICLFSMVYSGISMFAGGLAAKLLPVDTGRYIGVLFMISCALWLLLKDCRGKRTERNGSKQTEPVNVMTHPEEGDIDGSGRIDASESLLLTLALSFDALGGGFGAAMAGVYSWMIPIITGLLQLFFLYTGLVAGNRLSSVLNPLKMKNGLMTAVPGLLLLTVALFRLLAP